jgi:hypothetical protein
MKYLIVKIGETEVPMIFGNDVDLNQVKFPWPIVAAGVGVVQNMFVSCQLTQTIDGKEYVSRGLKDEILLRAADYIGEENPQIGFNNLTAPQEIAPEQLEEVKESFANVPVGEVVEVAPEAEEKKED